MFTVHKIQISIVNGCMRVCIVDDLYLIAYVLVSVAHMTGRSRC